MREVAIVTSVVTRPEDVPVARLRRQRSARRVGLLMLAGFVLLGLANTVGMRTGQATATGAGARLFLTYAAVTRSGLETPWEVEVVSPAGFRGAVTVTTTSSYFERFDLNGWYPEPASMSVRDGLLALTFERPEGEVLRVRFDGRGAPTGGRGAAGRTPIDTQRRAPVGGTNGTVVVSRWRSWCGARGD
jgi:hypothetical protein